MQRIRTSKRSLRLVSLGLFFLSCCAIRGACQRYVIADQDASGPGGSDMMALLVLLQSPDVHLLGITVVSGDSWRDEEVAHALRLVESVGRNDVKVYPGAAFPLVRTLAWTRLADKMYGAATFQGAFSDNKTTNAWNFIPPMRESKNFSLAGLPRIQLNSAH